MVSLSLFPSLVLTLRIAVRSIRDHNTDEHDGVHGDAAHGAEASLFGATGPGSDLIGRGRLDGAVIGAAFQRADEHAVEDLARFIRVADVFKGFGSVLPADIEKDFFAAADKGVFISGRTGGAAVDARI